MPDRDLSIRQSICYILFYFISYVSFFTGRRSVARESMSDQVVSIFWRCIAMKEIRQLSETTSASPVCDPVLLRFCKIIFCLCLGSSFGTGLICFCVSHQSPLRKARRNQVFNAKRSRSIIRPTGICAGPRTPFLNLTRLCHE
jgi:hypothetical protein